MHIALTVVAVLVISFLFALLAKKLKFPSIIGFLIAGIILGSPFVRDIVLEPNTGFVLFAGNIGFLCLMFLSGLEVSWTVLRREKMDAIYVALFAALTPFLLGFLIFYALGFSIVTALTVGICLSITAEATKTRTLMDLKKLKTRIGSLMVEAGIIDDIVGISLFVIVGFLLTESFFIEESLFLIEAIIAFLLGILLQKTLGRERISAFEKFLTFFIIPFFLVSMGIMMNMMYVVFNPLLVLIIILVAIFGKVFGTFLAKPFLKISNKKLSLVGLGMNSRGAVELVIAFIALKAGMIPTDVYSGIVVMVIITSLLFQFALTEAVRETPRIMD